MKSAFLSLSFVILTLLIANSPDQTNNLAFSTFLGGSDGEVIRDVESDGSGNIYVTGTTRSPDFPTTPGAYDREFDTSLGKTRWGYNSEIFVSKFSPSGELVWSTFIGGPNSEEAYGLEIDSKGYVMVHGRGAVGSPVTKGVYQEQFKGCGGGDPGNPHNTAQNAYICKLAPDGSAMVWGSFFGIDHLHRDLALDKNDDIYFTYGNDNPDGIRIDSQGNLVLFGQTNSGDFPTSKDAYQATKGMLEDAVIVKLSPNLDKIIYSTFLGGDGNDNGRAGCLDKDGSMIVAGSISGGNLPTKNAFQDSYRGSGDAFVAKLSIKK